MFWEALVIQVLGGNAVIVDKLSVRYANNAFLEAMYLLSFLMCLLSTTLVSFGPSTDL